MSTFPIAPDQRSPKNPYARPLRPTELPPALGRLKFPPTEVFVEGPWPIPGASVAVVGTRKASPEAAAFAKDLAAELASAGITVVSGGAEGIDEAAHRGALAGRGRTLVVLATGNGYNYPSKHDPLYREVIARGSTLLWPFSTWTRPHHSTFFARNRVLVALSRAVVVVQAGKTSGALNAARHARQLGRPLFAVAGPPWEKGFEGSTGLVGLGARIVMGIPSLLKALVSIVCVPEDAQISLPMGSARAEGTLFEPSWKDRPHEWHRVGEACRTIPQSRDALIALTGRTPAAVAALLLDMELAGVLQQDGAGYFHTRGRLVRAREGSPETREVSPSA